jgi:hypothetical protein
VNVLFAAIQKKGPEIAKRHFTKASSQAGIEIRVDEFKQFILEWGMFIDLLNRGARQEIASQRSSCIISRGDPQNLIAFFKLIRRTQHLAIDVLVPSALGSMNPDKEVFVLRSI